MMANRDAWYRLFVNRAAEFAVFAAGHEPIVALNDHEKAASKAVRRYGPGTTLHTAARKGMHKPASGAPADESNSREDQDYRSAR